MKAFLKRHDATIPKSNWFEDEGWARDTADKRPNFQKMLQQAKAGRIKWIIVDKLDRFGWKSSKQLMHFLYQLEEAGCLLYDSTGKEWTSADDATEITALLEGKNSVKETREKSYRVMGGMVEQARNGEWMGGPVRLGFDVGCFACAEPEKELWRVVLEGRDKRLKVYPDGRTERFDGPGNYPAHQGKRQGNIEMLRLVPSNDKAKLEAARSVFERYATESISFTVLADYLNSLGMRTCYGVPFLSVRIEEMLNDPIYMGYATWNKVHRGKFHRWLNGQAAQVKNFKKKLAKNAETDWVQSKRLFDALIQLNTWNRVQEKLRTRTLRARSPNSHQHYLGGLLTCANCGLPMIAGRPSAKGWLEYICGGYHRRTRYKGRRKIECNCLRNSVFQDDMERFVEWYLEETGQRLDILTSNHDTDHLTERLEGDEHEHWWEFALGLERLQMYLYKHHPEEYREVINYNSGEDATEYEYIQGLVDLYRKHFDPSAVEAEIEKLEAEHDALMKQWADLPTARAKEKKKARFAELETKMEQLRRQKEDASAVVEEHY